MINFLKQSAVVAVIALASSLAQAQLPSPFVLRVDDGGVNGVVISDGGPGDTLAALGAIGFSGAFGGFTFNVVTGLSKPLLPNSSFMGQMDLNDVSIHGTGAGTIRLTLEDTSFGGSPFATWTQTRNIGGTLSGSGATITAQDWVNTSNDVPYLGSPTGTIGAIGAIGALPGDSFAVAPLFSAGAGAFSGGASSLFSPAGAFSMFQQVTVKFASSGGIVSFDNHHIAAIPEPETYGMLLAGLGLMGFVALRRRGKDAVWAANG